MAKLSGFAESMNEIEHELREYIYAAALSFYQRTLFKKSDHLSTVAKQSVKILFVPSHGTIKMIICSESSDEMEEGEQV